MVSITIDTDWAPEPVLADTLDILAEQGCKATLFCTSPYPSTLLGPNETALHPNYRDRTLGEEEHLKRLLDIYPEARGVRAHSLYSHGGLITDTYPRLGIEYVSDYLMPYQENITPYNLLGLWQFPIFFSDISWLRDRKTGRFTERPVFNLAADNLKVFCFHPIHIYVNTPSVDYYQAIKKSYQQPDELLLLRNQKGPGIRDLFIDLLNELKQIGARPSPLGEVMDNL